MKLELKHLAHYLPHGLRIEHPTMMSGNRKISEMRNLGQTSIEISHRIYVQISSCKPLLRPLSYLTKEIEIDGKKFVPMEYFFEFENPNNKIPKRMKYYYEEVPNRISISHNASSRSTEVLFSEMGANPYWIIQKLFEWHFDVFGLIDQGLALPLI